MKTKKSVSHLHEEHKDWLSRLDFYQDELKVMQHRIEEVATANTKKDILQQVEHFQNQFIIQGRKAEELKRVINREERHLLMNAEFQPDKATQEALDFNRGEREEMRTFDRLFVDLKHELNAFLVKTL